MSFAASETRSVIVEHQTPHPPEKVWRALTEPHLVSEWLIRGDFAAVAGHDFAFDADWGAVQGKVLAAEPHRLLSYTWNSKGLRSVITWTLTATATGTNLLMVQSGFTPEQTNYYRGAQQGWPGLLAGLDAVLGRPS